MNKVKYGLLVLTFLITKISSVSAADIADIVETVTQQIDFGSFMIKDNSKEAVITLDTNGTIKSNYTNVISQNKKATQGIVKFETSLPLTTIDSSINNQNETFNIGCATMTIVINPQKGFTQNVGGTITIPAGTDTQQCLGQLSGAVTFKTQILGHIIGGIYGHKTITLQANINIERIPIDVQLGKTLNFGQLISSNEPYTITIDKNGVVSGNKNMMTKHIQTSQGTFNITGTVNSHINAQIIAEGSSEQDKTITLKNDTGGTMTIQNVNGALDSGSMEGTILPNGTTLSVGGTLHVNANQQPGIYTGHYSVTVNY